MTTSSPRSTRVTLCNARGVHEASTAELAVGLIIAGLRGFPGFVRAQDQRVWLHARHDALADQTVVVVGAGSVGRAVVARLEPFEANVITVARTARTGVRGVDALPSILPTADVVVMVVPFNESTHGMVDARFLALMKDRALLVNIARGPVVVTSDLLTELYAGRLRAALDVTDQNRYPSIICCGAHPMCSSPLMLGETRLPSCHVHGSYCTNNYVGMSRMNHCSMSLTHEVIDTPTRPMRQTKLIQLA